MNERGDGERVGMGKEKYGKRGRRCKMLRKGGELKKRTKIGKYRAGKKERK